MPDPTTFLGMIAAVSSSDTYNWLRRVVEHGLAIIGLAVAGSLMWFTLQDTVADNVQDIAGNKVAIVIQAEELRKFRETQVKVTTTLEAAKSERAEIKHLLERIRDREFDNLRRHLPSPPPPPALTTPRSSTP